MCIRDRLEENRDVLDRIADYLFEHETITGKEFMRIYREIKGIPQPPDEEEKPPVQMQGFRQASQPGAGANPGAGQGLYVGTDADSRNPGRQNAGPNGQNYRMPNMQNPVNQDYMMPNGQNQTMPSGHNPMSPNQTMPNMQHPSGQNQGMLNGQNPISRNHTMPIMQNASGQNQAMPNMQIQQNMAVDQNAFMQVPGNGQHVGMGRNMQEAPAGSGLSVPHSQEEHEAGSGSSAQHLHEDGQRSSQEDQQRKQ